MGEQVAYVRVSSVDQNLDRQLVGVDVDNTFEDKCSGATKNRPGLTACLKHLRKDDTLHVHSIDRLARNLFDLQSLVSELTDRGVAVQFHKEGLIFSGDANPMQTLQLQMMGAFAQFERSLIRERQREGIAAAKARGQKLGRASKFDDAAIAQIKADKDSGTTVVDLAKQHDVTRVTIYKALAS